MKHQLARRVLKIALAWMIAARFIHSIYAVPDSFTLIGVLDVDSDGVIDFELREGFLSEPRSGPACNPRLSGVIGLYGLGDNRILINDQFPCISGAHRLAKGDPIPPLPVSSSHWSPDAELRLSWGSPAGMLFEGPFATETNGYLGLSFRSGGTERYGWVQIGSTTSLGQLQILGFGAASALETSTFAGGTPQPASEVTIPILVPPNRATIGTILSSRSTNRVSGVVSWELKLRLNNSLKCLTDPGEPGWPQSRYPVTLVERSIVPNPLPSEWAWSESTGEFLLSSGSQSAHGAILGEFGPFAGRASVMIGIRDATGNCWWVDVGRSGDVLFVGYSPKQHGELLVGAPYGVGGTNGWYDLDGDGLVDFIYWEAFQAPATTRHLLQPMRGNRVLMNTLARRWGQWVGASPSQGDVWSDQAITLLEHEMHSQNFGPPQWTVIHEGVLGGTNGHVAVQFQIDNQPHHGWIQFNYYTSYLAGMFGNVQSGPPSLVFHDFGYQRQLGSPVVIGLESSVVPRVQVLGGELRVTWPRFNSRTTLERTSSLGAPIWEAVADIRPGAYRTPLDPTRVQAFFRLKTPLPFPEIVITSPGLPLGREVPADVSSLRK